MSKSTFSHQHKNLTPNEIIKSAKMLKGVSVMAEWWYNVLKCFYGWLG